MFKLSWMNSFMLAIFLFQNLIKNSEMDLSPGRRFRVIGGWVKHARRNSLGGKQQGQERSMQEEHSKKQSGVYSLGQMKMVVAPHLVRGMFGNGRSSKWCVRSRLGEEDLARRRGDLQQLLALHSRQAPMAVLGWGR